MNEDKQNIRTENKKVLIHFFFKLVVSIVTVLLIFSFILGIGVMHGEYMYPKIRDGDLYLYYRLESTYHIGDVVTTKYEGIQYVARIVAAEGDSVDITDEGQLMINGNIVDEEIFYPTYKDNAQITFPITVGDNSYFMLCDFRTDGKDSRLYGTVSKSHINGKLISLLRRRGI